MKLKCLKCGDIIESKSIHDLKFCSCKSCCIDGGNECIRIGYKNRNDIVEIFDDGKTQETIKKKFYKVEIVELLRRVLIVEAEEKNEALRIAKEKYRKEEIVLTAEDFNDVTFNII